MDETAGKRRVRTKDGQIGVVMSQLSTRFVSVLVRRHGYYKVYNVDDLEDTSEEDFRRHFR